LEKEEFVASVLLEKLTVYVLGIFSNFKRRAGPVREGGQVVDRPRL
jgi:hypothetical protein